MELNDIANCFKLSKIILVQISLPSMLGYYAIFLTDGVGFGQKW